HTRFSRDWSSDVCSSDLVGTLEEVQVTGKDGAVHAITAGAKDITSDGAIAGSLASNISGMSNVQAGAALGLASGVLDFVSRLSRSEERRVGKEWRSGWSA